MGRAPGVRGPLHVRRTIGGVTVTRRQLDCVRAHVSEGTSKAAAYRLGLSPSTLRAHLARARVRTAVETTEQLVYLLATSRELVVEDWRGE